jgi:ParB family chromosome partitioning protein
LDVHKIQPNPFQPRRIFDEDSLRFLAESVKRNGVLQPILVIGSEENGYRLVAGERRLRASKIADMATIPAVVMNVGEREQLEISILENIQREDLNPIDEAEAYRRLMNEFGHSQEQLAEILGKSRSHITNIMRLLTLPESVKKLLREKKLTFGHARTLVGLDDAEKLAEEMVRQPISVRQAENTVKSMKNAKNNGRRERSNVDHTDPEMLNLADQISSLTGLKSNIKLKNSGGTVEIVFDSFEELDSLIKRLDNTSSL